MSQTTAPEKDQTGPETIRIPDTLPIVPLRDLVAFPHMMFPLVVSEPGLLHLADEALSGDKMIGLFTVRPVAGEDAASPGLEAFPDTEMAARPVVPDALCRIGTAALIHKMIRFPDGGMRLLVQGTHRLELVETLQTEPYMKGRVRVVPPGSVATKRAEALRRNALELFQKLVDATGYLTEELKVVAFNVEDPGRLADFLGANVNLKLSERVSLLEELDPGRRIEQVTAYMVRELDILALGRRLQDEVQSEMGRAQREFYLRQQLKAIQKELGGGEEENPEHADLRRRIEDAGMPDVAQAAALKEYERLTRMPPQAAEYTVALTYIDWMLQMPWHLEARPVIDIERAQRILDEDHYDLTEVKERILEYLAVRKLKAQPRSPILCLTGPPGVGKTSLGQSIARALGRPFVRLALGGLHDEAEIRGHRRTYIGAMPGRILQGIASAKALDPVFMLDEIDKVGSDFRGDPTSALLEVLDPAQNHAFQDNYLNVVYDLSRVLFITTANVLYTIPPPLRDRMEIIDLPGYSTEDKVHIARRYLVPRAHEDNGIETRHLKFTRGALVAIASLFTREAGVRNLEREIQRVARKVASRVARGRRVHVTVNEKNLVEYLGQPKVFLETREATDRVGVATGLAWTPFGGEILFVEAARMPGRGTLNLTGQLGNVMRESAQAALTYVRAHIKEVGGEGFGFARSDLHIHVPSGAMPKDGPSAGLAMVTALASVVGNRPVRSDTAMTGEISLRGNVLPVGGVLQKVLGARRAGIRRIVLPADNAADLVDLPPEARESMEFVLVSRMEKALEAALRPAVRPGRHAAVAAKKSRPTKAAKGRSRSPRRAARAPR